jgi:hypothetical protein
VVHICNCRSAIRRFRPSAWRPSVAGDYMPGPATSMSIAAKRDPLQFNWLENLLASASQLVECFIGSLFDFRVGAAARFLEVCSSLFRTSFANEKQAQTKMCRW